MTEKVYFDCSVPQMENEISLQGTKENIEDNTKYICTIIEEMQNKLLIDPPNPCSVINIPWLTQTKYNITKYLLENDVNVDGDSINTDAETYVELYKTLILENQQQGEALKYISQELNQELAELAEIKECLKCMETNEDESDNETDPELLDLVKINQKISKYFVDLKKDLHSVLNTFFEVDMKELIQKLTEAYFKGGDERYIDVDEDIDLNNIMFLKTASLIVTDPYNIKRIKFDDLA